ncbi:hypothetical protein AFK49_005705 [Corynebacterium ulcerans]|nr:hypothetical protein AFK49_005705 [Corynebacterium ulcerans]
MAVCFYSQKTKTMTGVTGNRNVYHDPLPVWGQKHLLSFPHKASSEEPPPKVPLPQPTYKTNHKAQFTGTDKEREKLRKS